MDGQEIALIKALAKSGSGVSTDPQELTTEQKIQALKNLDGIRVVMLDSGSVTLAELTEMIADINEDGEHVFFDVAALSYPLYLCTIAINYDDDTPVSYRLNDLVTGSISMGSYDGSKTLSTILAEAVNGFYTITVTAVTQDGVTVTGQTVTVRSTDASGAVYATAVYGGQPVSFSVPNGFVYYISITSTLAGHFNPTTASGIINGADVAVTLTYSDFSTIQRFADVKAALDEDLDLTDLVGQQVYMLKDNKPMYFDVVDYDDTTGTITLLGHSIEYSYYTFDSNQALAWFENGLEPGDYYFTSNNTNYYFTITTAIPSGGQLRATTTQFWTYESQNSDLELESGTVATSAITGATSIGVAGAGLLNHLEVVIRGSGNFAESGVLQWLNSSAEQTYAAMPRITRLSRPYKPWAKGFLAGVDQSDLSVVEDAEWACKANNIYECPEALGGVTRPGETYKVTAKFALASRDELNGGSGSFDLYRNAPNEDRVKYARDSAIAWWLRSAGESANYPGYADSVGPSGSITKASSSTTIVGAVPCCKIRRTQGGQS